MLTKLDCTKCDRHHDAAAARVCECGAPLLARYDLAQAALDMRPGHLALREPTLWRYREVLPADDPDDRVSLGEGFTPLLATPRLGAQLGLPKLLVKEEADNPTGSFKSRGLALAVTMAKRGGATELCLSSGGNAAAALAAYAARAGLKAHLFLPRDVARLVLTEAAACGAEARIVEGPRTEADRVSAEEAARHGWYDCAAFREPFRVEGQKTTGYEIAEQMSWALPDAILCPTGTGLGLVALAKAVAEMSEMGFVPARRPRFYAVQAEGCAPIVRAFQEDREETDFWDAAATRAHGLRVPKPFGDTLILRALRESHGAAIAVSDGEMIEGVKVAAASEGLFMGLEGGACVAAARKLKASGHLSAEDSVVILDTVAGDRSSEAMEPLWTA